MSQNYLITITGGTSPGPYTIYYNLINSSNIALKYLYYTPATGVTLNELTSGYSVTVPDNTTVLYLYNNLCDVNQSFPVSSATTTYDFCVLFKGDEGTYFIPNGLVNGYQSWISDDGIFTITFDETINKWKISGGYLDSQTYMVVSDSSYPPINGWYLIGGGTDVDRIPSYSGQCQNVKPLGFNYTKNDPGCECDGNIVFQGYGGTPPYQYSIDNGVTKKSSPIFNNLCNGTYTLHITDSNNQTFSETISLVSTQTVTTYTLTVLTISNTVSNSPTSKTTRETTTLTVSPSLPVGATITMNINHLNQFSSAPNPTTATLTTNTILSKNGTPQPLPNQTINYFSTTNTLPGCQGNIVTTKDTTDVWSNVTMTLGDTIILETTTTVSWTPSQCLVAEAENTYYITNYVLNGCSCCSLVVN